MKPIVAIALFVLVVTQAQIVPEFTLRGSRFLAGHTYTYDTFINVTAGVLGLSSQVSASVLRANVKIYAKTDTECILSIENAKFSGSVPAIDNMYGDVELHEEEGISDRLATPTKFFLEDGKVIKYTLSRKDNLESTKIKRSILRSLEMHIPEFILQEMEKPEREDHPIMFNETENTDYGVHVSNYIITVSPDVEFPKDTMVYNISRIDNYEGEWYPSYKLHHNFQMQGCPEVCRQSGEGKENFYQAGCPSGFESQNSPIKRAFNHQHSLSFAEGRLTPERITTFESHFAKMYDQDMEVLIRYQMERTGISTEEIIYVESDQPSYEDLNKKDLEVTEHEIDQICNYKSSIKLVESAKELLEEVSVLIVASEPGSPIGEKILLLRDALSKFTVSEFKKMQPFIPELKSLQFIPDSKSVVRQIWLEILPLVGTSESVKFIVDYITNELEGKNMLVWEAKEMLESLPQNIERPDEETLKEIEKLLKGNSVRKSALLHSAAHLTMGRVIGRICGNVHVPKMKAQDEKRSWLLKNFKMASSDFTGLTKCPEERALRITEKISQELKKTNHPEEMAVYIETLTRTGMEQALLKVTDYVHGTAQNMRHLSPKHLDFMRSLSVYALHNIAGRHPQQVLEMVLPIFFNDTETPKLRNAAFGVLIRCQPSISVLQRVATHSWFEKSREVGSFVTSTLESFGNSTLPCMQLLSHRIKEILPQVKRFNIGVQHAKNHMWTYFDALRQFGLEGRLDYTPNNESVVPSAFYHALSYTIGSLRDTVFQGSLNMEGFTQDMLFQRIHEAMDLPYIEPISHEKDIFGEGEQGMDFMVPRTVEDLRLVAHHKLFYKSSYNYLSFSGIETAKREFSEIFEKYFIKSRSSYSGYLVKLFLPSTYHTKAIAKTLPYPVEFQMRQPIVVSLGVKSGESTTNAPTLKHFDLHLKPSIHLSKVFTHQMKNMRDCKEVGVYHTHKIAMTYPFQLEYNGYNLPKIVFKYKIPEKQKKVLYYFTESGTYAEKKELKSLPWNGANVPIRTLPEPFKFEKVISLVGIPPFHVEVESEDINLFHYDIPRTPTEVLDLAIKNVLNAGWRYKSANITLVENRAVWTRENEAKFEVEYSRNHILKKRNLKNPEVRPWPAPETSDKNAGNSIWQRQPDSYKNPQRWEQNFRSSEDRRGGIRESEDGEWKSPNYRRLKEDESISNSGPWETENFMEFENDDRYKESMKQSDDEDWTQYMEPTKNESFTEFSKNAKAVSNIMSRLLPHINHRLKISISAEPLSSTAYLLMDYNHTYDKFINVLHFQAVSKRANELKPYEIDVDHIVGYFNRPNELHYDDEFGRQKGYFKTAIRWPKDSESESPFEKMAIIITGEKYYESNKDLLNQMLRKAVGEKYFLPETHEECKRDVEDERPLSPNCIKAIREHSAFNRIKMNIRWKEDLPKYFKQYARVADVYLKYFYMKHLHLKAEENDPRRIDISMEYIDKFVDEPLANWEIRKPSETVFLRQIPVGDVQPFSSIYPLHETAVLKITNNSYPAHCVLTDSYVQTYDLVTYPFKPEDCHYVLSSHCTGNKNFAVILRGSGKNKEIHIHVASTKTVLLPRAENSLLFTVRHDGEDIEIVHPTMLNEAHEIYAYVERHSDAHLRFIAKEAGISVLYDGKTVKIQVSLRYKGELCGLCSEFDGEELREFRGMDRCLYAHPVDFANSAIVKRSGNCDVRYFHGDRVCDNPEFNENNEDHHAGRLKSDSGFQRNFAIMKGDKI